MSTSNPLPTIPGLILRTQDNTVYFVPVTELMNYRLPDALQAGTPDGNRAQTALDQCADTAGVKNALMTRNGMVQDTDPASPTHGKEKFAPDAFEATPAGSPQGGKEKFADGVFGDVASASPQGGKEKFAGDTIEASAPQNGEKLNPPSS